MNSRVLKVGIVGIVLVLAAYWYWSPLVAIHQMRSAAQAGDADAFNDHVDYPKLRESLKGQFSVALTSRLASQPQSENEVAKAGAALGAMLGMAMVDKMVDAFVRPETVMRAMQEGKLMPKENSTPRPAPRTSAEASEKVTWQSERKGVDKYIVFASRPGEAEDERVGLVLERSGFATWKLTEIRLPSLQ